MSGVVNLSKEIADCYVDVRNNESPVGLAHMEVLAKEGVELADCFLMVMHHYGLGVPRDREESAKIARWCVPWLVNNTSAEEINETVPYSWYILAICYSDGIGMEKSAELEFQWLHRVVSANSFAPALNTLASLYRKGEGVAQNESQSFYLLSQASTLGYAPSISRLAKAYAEGRGTLKNETLALSLFQKAHNMGCIEGIYELGLCYRNGRCVAKDHTEAVRLFTIASDKRYSSAQYYLGQCYEEGKGEVEINILEAIRYYRLAAHQGHKRAKICLARCLLLPTSSSQDHLRNQAEALLLLQSIFAEIDSKHARYARTCTWLAICYLHGYGCQQSDSQALRFYTNAIYAATNGINKSSAIDIPESSMSELFRVACEHNRSTVIIQLQYQGYSPQLSANSSTDKILKSCFSARHEMGEPIWRISFPLEVLIESDGNMTPILQVFPRSTITTIIKNVMQNPDSLEAVSKFRLCLQRGLFDCTTAAREISFTDIFFDNDIEKVRGRMEFVYTMIEIGLVQVQEFTLSV